MIPTIVQLGPLPVNSFGLMIALAILAAIYRLSDSFKAHGLNPALAERFVFTGALTGLLGARIWYIVRHWEQVKGDLWGAIFAGSGFTFYGGWVAAFLMLLWLCKHHAVPFHKFVDAVGPTMALGYAIGRVGCQLAGDGDYGKATDSIWGISYATGVVPTAPGVMVFPTPFFESLMSLAICGVLLKFDSAPQLQKRYGRFGLYLMLIAVERFLIEFIRVNKRFAFGLSEAHYVSIFLMFAGVLLLLRPARHKVST